MKKNRKNYHAGRIVSLLLVLCMVLSIVPITAFAGVTDVTDGTTSTVYNHTYHTKVKLTANVTLQDSEGNTVNTYPVSEESDDFLVGNVSDDAVQAEITRLEAVVNSQLPSGAVKSNRTTSTTFDHFESSYILDSSKDQTLIGDNAQDESGTTSTLDVHEYQIYEITDDYTIVAIDTVDFGNVWKILDSTQSVPFTAELNPNTDCPNQMEIASEFWSAWLGDGNIDEITSFDEDKKYPTAGRTYEHGITLTAKDGYLFPYKDSEDIGVYGEFLGTIICDGTTIVNNGTPSDDVIADVSDNGMTLRVFGYPQVTATDGGSQNDYVINNVVINNAPASCTVGEAPKATATKGDNEAYTFCEYWEEWAQTGNGLEPVKFWYSDAEQMNRVSEDKRITTFEEGKTYSYSVIAQANENYTFASKDALSVMLNGEDYTDKSEVILDGTGLMMGPGAFMMPVKPATPKEIPVVEINNATLIFKDGDKPVFTGTTPDDAPYVLVFEEWRTDGEWTRSEEWFNDADHHGSDKDITAFDKNKTYNYNLYLKTTAEGGEEGWYFGPNTKLKINGKEVSFTNNDPDVFMVTTGITMTPTAAGASDYKIIEGANGAWTQNTDGTLTFRANGDFSKFTGVKVDGKLIDAKNYTAKSGSTIVTLSTEYLKFLSVGTHNLSVVFTDGECSTSFEVRKVTTEQTTPAGSKNTKSPQTGDNSNLALWFAVLFVSGIGVLGTMVYSKRKKRAE